MSTLHRSATISLLLGLLILARGTGKAITLVENGRPHATIVVAAQTGPKVKAAADELQTYINKMSGATLPIATDADNPAGALALVGRSKFTDAMGVNVPSGVTALRREEGFVIVCKGDRLALAGNNEANYHGTEYAVYDFLERLGVRWYMPTDFGEIVPKTTTITFADATIAERPDFCMRDGEFDPKWSLRNKSGFASDFVANDTSVWFYMPPFEERPELYALGPDGKRNRELGICYSSAATVKAVAERIVAAFKKDPLLNVIGFAPPDGVPACSCPDCQKAGQGLPNSSVCVNNIGDRNTSEEWMTFADKVAALVYKECPDRYVWTNGYSNRRFAPQGFKTFSPNLGVMFAALEDCTLHAFDDPKCWQKQAQALNLRRWLKLTNRKVSVYDYNLQMMVSSLTPLPMAHKLRRDMPLWKQWGVMGYFLCTRHCWAEEGILTKYLRAKLAWDADADVEAIMRDYYTTWYGKAARPMRAYWDTMEKATADAPFHAGMFNTILPEVYTPALTTKLEKSLVEGERAADSERYRLHVKLDRLIHEHLKAYVARQTADDECNYAECIRQATRMLDLRKQLNDLTGFPKMMSGEGGTTEDRIKEWQGWLDKMNGTSGTLIAILPAEARFKTDPNKEGYHFQWYKSNLNEKGWKPILTTKGWEAQGYRDGQGFNYAGFAWYRMTVDVPATAAGKRITLLMPGELEWDPGEAWCWANGEYAGRMQYRGWARFPHELDLTNLMKPGQRNQLTFRVLYTDQRYGASGIFRRMMLYSPIEPGE